MRCDCFVFMSMTRRYVSPPSRSDTTRWFAKNDSPSIFSPGLCAMKGFQFFSDGSAIGAVTTRKFLAALFVVI